MKRSRPHAWGRLRRISQREQTAPLPRKLLRTSGQTMPLFVMLACGPGDVEPVEQLNDTGSPAGFAGCRSTPTDPDLARVALVSLPYTADLEPSNTWAQLSVSAAGSLSLTPHRHSIGRARGGTMAFTPDGSVGIAVLDDGTLGVVQVSSDAEVTVTQSSFDPGTWVGQAAIEPSGESVLLTNPNWPDDGGGLYRAPIDCDSGRVGPAEFVIAAKNPSHAVVHPTLSEHAYLVGREIETTSSGSDAALVNLSTGTVLSDVDAFGDEEAIVSDAVLTPSGWLLMADNNEFSAQPNRIAAVRTSESGLSVLTETIELQDPVSLFPNPTATGVLAASGYGDAYYILNESSSADSHWSLGSQVDESGQPRVQLPTDGAVITRGESAGLTLIIEVGGVRSMWLRDTAAAELAGVLSFGDGYESVPGAIGIQP